jgi:hypothetical protein
MGGGQEKELYWSSGFGHTLLTAIVALDRGYAFTMHTSFVGNTSRLDDRQNMNFSGAILYHLKKQNFGPDRRTRGQYFTPK